MLAEQNAQAEAHVVNALEHLKKLEELLARIEPPAEKEKLRLFSTLPTHLQKIREEIGRGNHLGAYFAIVFVRGLLVGLQVVKQSDVVFSRRSRVN